MVHFDDGFAVYHQRGEKRSDETMAIEELEVESAMNIATWSIQSETDTRYNSATSPSAIGRKSKGTAFINLCEGWDNALQQCVNTSHDHAKEHWLYLTLPEPLQNGHRYTLSFSQLNDVDPVAFTYDYRASRSEAIHVNQVGYSTSATRKYGYAYHWMGDQGGLDLSSYEGRPFHLLSIDSQDIAFSGTLTFRKAANNPETGQSTDTPQSNFLGADVYECDFSDFNTPGTYVLAIEGLGRSFPFEIGDQVFWEPYYHGMRGLYHNRSGIALQAPYTEFERPAPHNPSLTPGFDGKLVYTTSRFVDWSDADHSSDDKAAIEAGILGPIDTWGWYQDAGDWDGYFSHLRIPALLMFTYEFRPGNFLDRDLSIPESGNGIPDILDEARWLIRFLYRTRHAIMDAGYGSGGLGTRITGDHFGGGVLEDDTTQGSWEDISRTWIVSGEDPWSTFFYAGLAAHFGTILVENGWEDPEGIEWIAEAANAYDWAKSVVGDNSEIGEAQNGSTETLERYRAYAAAALFRATATSSYRERIYGDTADIQPETRLTEDQRWGAYMVLLADETQDVDELHISRIYGSVLTTGDHIMLDTVENRACRWAGDWFFPMLIGQPTTPRIFEGMAAWYFSKELEPQRATEYLAYMHTTCDYFLGTNPLNMAWMSGIGERHPTQFLHLDGWYNGKDRFHPGIVPYGPWRKSADYGGGAWDHNWPIKTIYPENMDDWPGHERWFEQRYAPTSSEFTVHQNTALAASAYGFLLNPPKNDAEATEVQIAVAQENILLTFPTERGVAYEVENSVNMEDWEQTDFELIGNGEEGKFRGPIPEAAQHFYRVNSNALPKEN